MKSFIVFLVIIGIFIILIYPPVNSERTCYVNAQKSMDDVSAKVFSQRISVEQECSQKTDVLNTLETCMQEATASSTVARYSNDTVQRIVAIIRPYGKNLWTLKVEHNLSCADFSWYQLP